MLRGGTLTAELDRSLGAGELDRSPSKCFHPPTVDQTHRHRPARQTTLLTSRRVLGKTCADTSVCAESSSVWMPTVTAESCAVCVSLLEFAAKLPMRRSNSWNSLIGACSKRFAVYGMDIFKFIAERGGRSTRSSSPSGGGPTSIQLGVGSTLCGSWASGCGGGCTTAAGFCG